MTVGQKVVLVITAIIFLLLGFAWIFSDASMNNPFSGLLLFYVVIGVPAFLIYKALSKK